MAAGLGHKELLGRLGRPAADAEVASGLLETAVRLLRTAGTAVSAVDIEPASDDVPELRWDTVTARVGLATATGTRPVTVSAEYGLALAAVAGAPVRVADEVMDRLAVPVPGRGHAGAVPASGGGPAAGPSRRVVSSRGTWRSPTAWTTGNWLAASPTDGQPAGPDYSCTAADQSAVLAATVPEPAGFGRPRPGHRRRRLPRPHGHLPRAAARHRHGRPGRAAPGRERAAGDGPLGAPCSTTAAA